MSKETLYFQTESRVYLGKILQNAYQNPVFVFTLNKCGVLTTTQNTLSAPTERVFTLPLAESDYDTLHRVIDSQGSCRFSFCIGYYILKGVSVVFSTEEVHITLPFPNPKKDYVTAYVCSDVIIAKMSYISLPMCSHPYKT